jgi:MFS family permease
MQTTRSDIGLVQLPQERRGIDALAMLIVALLSVVLLVYVAFGEAKRTYEQFQIEKLVAQGQVVQSAVEGFVRPGFPIHQFVGFNGLTEPMVKADPLIDAISAFDVAGTRVFGSGDQGALIIPEANGDFALKETGHQVRRSGDLLQVILPVRNRFEQVGYVVLSIPRAKLAEQVEEAFVPVVKVGIGAAFAFALFVYLFASHFSISARRNWVAAGFVVTFLSVAVMVVSTLVSVYSLGAQARTKSLADSLGQRLDDLVIYNINMDDITGIISLFGDYKRLNPDLRAAALIVDGKIRAHVDPNRRGTDWDSVPSDHEYTVRLSADGSPREVLVKVALPRDVVFRQVSRSVKNFTALLVASALFAALFMGLARSLQLLSQSRDDGRWSIAEETATIDLVKPMFFLAVFVEHLSYAFLPPLMQTYAAAAKLPAGYASAPFIAYYVCFTLALLPAGRLEAKLGARTIIMLGLSMAGLGLGAMALMTDFWHAVAARALCGLGQGTLFIGVQAYILANSSPERKTQAGGAIVFGFQAGMIAGMAIGSLLVSYLGNQGIFQLGAALSGLAIIYGIMALPSRLSGTTTPQSAGSIFADIWTILRDHHFLRTMLLIGIPAKAVLTGVVLFALPILLTQQGFPKEDIGQITMLYACAVILSSHFATASADRSKSTEGMLFKGTFLTAVGLIMISVVGFPGLISWETSSNFATFMVVIGATLVGVAHGFINAPVVTHVTNSELSATIGTTNVAAGYRLLERIGHTAGPLIMGQIFVYAGVSWTVMLGIGVAVFIFGLLFLSPEKPVPSHSQTHSA